MLKEVFNYNNSLLFLKNKLGNNYPIFVKDFVQFKSTNAECVFGYAIIDNYAIVNVTKIYELQEYIDWLAKNEISVKNFDISKYLVDNDEQN